MPHILRDVNPIVATLLTQHHIFYDRAIIIVSSHSNLASQDNERLILRRVPMDGYHSPWLHGIQEPMAFIIQRLMKVIVHAQTGRNFRLRTNHIQKLLIDKHYRFFTMSTKCRLRLPILTPHTFPPLRLSGRGRCGCRPCRRRRGSRLCSCARRPQGHPAMRKPRSLSGRGWCPPDARCRSSGPRGARLCRFYKGVSRLKELLHQRTHLDGLWSCSEH